MSPVMICMAFGRIVALYYRSPTVYLLEYTRFTKRFGASFSETTMCGRAPGDCGDQPVEVGLAARDIVEDGAEAAGGVAAVRVALRRGVRRVPFDRAGR